MNSEPSRMSQERRLEEALKALLRKKNADRISVTEIAEEAGVIRATFYNHFSDKAELVKWIVVSEAVTPAYSLFQDEKYREAAVLIFRNMKADGAFYQQISEMTKPVSFREILAECVHDLMIDHMEKNETEAPDHPLLPARMIADLSSRVAADIVMEWIRTGMEAAPEKIAETLEYLGTHSFKDICKPEGMRE